MAQPNTQDTQKVFHSATENFKSFVGSVENVSNTKHMEDIYANMTKLFDAFTNGALLEQGANSETLLRTVYRSLDEDFLEIVQDSKAVDKLIEVIKSKQEGIEPEKVADAMVSETTKKVVTKTLDPETCDPMQVVLDFIDELQTSILQVRLNLSREYERRRLEYAKSLAGQQEDLDKLKGESEEQAQQISETLGQVATDETTWKDAQLKELSRLMEKFDQATSKASDNILAQTLQEDKTLVEMSKEQKKVNWDKLISGIQGQQTKLLKQAQAEPIAQPQPQQSQEASDQKPWAVDSEKPQLEGQKPRREEEPPKDDLSAEAAKMEKVSQDMSKVKQPKLTPPPANGSKLNVSPSKNGMCVCPICGHMHPKGGAHVPPPSPDGSNGGGKLTQGGVINTIGKIHENVQRQLNNKKFRNAFALDLNKVQGGLQKQMKKVDKTESTISKDLGATKKGIKSLKRQLAASKGKGILGLIFGGPIGMIAFTIVGGLILITLARLALKKWSDTYMPKKDGSKASIFGIPIPGWDTMKALGLGIWNFITVGLPNYWDRLKHFMGNVKKQLFGKNGMFKDAIETRNTIRKIIGALIIANTKKAGGVIAKYLLKALGLCFCWIPGVKPVCDFLAEFGPAIYTFVATQIMLIWSNKKADAERGAQAMAADQMATGKSQVKHFKNMLLSNAKGVKPFKGQLNAIPGLQTSKGGKGAGGPARAAIMRAIPVHHNKNFGKSTDMQKDKLDKDKKSAESEVESRLKDNKPDDLLVKINADMDTMNQRVRKDFDDWWKNRKANGRDEQGRTWEVAYREIKEKARRETIGKTITPQILAIDNYIGQLSKSQRFKNVKGPLYDPNTGWNPGYRVYASDLRSIIPLNPFESVHQKPDIYFGKPAEAEVDSIGFMPFTWIQDGVKMAVHPINYEIARARGIRMIYQQMLNMLEYGWKPDLKKFAGYWVEWNKALVKHSFGEYENEDNVLFKDRFVKFIKKLREGKVQGKDNTLDAAMKQPDGWFAEKTQGMLDAAGLSGAEAGIVLGAGAMVGLGGAAIAFAAIKGIQAAKKVGKDVNRMLNYDRAAEGVNGELKDNKDLGWWDRGKLLAKRKKRQAEAIATVISWRKTKNAGIEYGGVRDFWLESGALDLFANHAIMGTVGAAIPLIDFLIGKGMFPSAPPAKNANRIHDLMHWFFTTAGIKGYDWKQVVGDEASQAGFAQVFLEYLRYKVLPQWNRVEKLLSDEITYKTQKTQARLLKGVMLLNTLMSPKGIFAFMDKQLRFPNMKVKLIDYSNASGDDRKKLDMYRMQMGIPDAKGKNTILTMLQGTWDKIGDMTDEKLDALIGTVKGLMAKAEFEARYTGDYTYFKQLKQHWDRLEKEKQARLDAQASGNKIVKKPGEVPTKVLEPPPKTMAEIEEEKRKAAAEEAKRKMEEERKAKEEREKKLKEEAKRKEALAVANAKIKAMEAIRKQEENYEAILQKMIGDPGKVTDAELKSLGDEVKNLKQEAENQIAKLPREERELKLALIRGDKISEKTFSEIKETAVGLHGNLQEYIEEVNQIPVGSVLAIQNTPSLNAPQPVRMQDSDSVDLGDM